MSEREAQVGKYYDENTPSFFRFMRRSLPRTIHQPLYRDASVSAFDALHAAHELILGQIPSGTRNVLDLGCGIGESLMWFARRLPNGTQLTGITISSTQASIAKERIREAQAEDKIDVLEGSFLALPASLSPVHAAYAIESFIHAGDADRFFASVSSVLQTGAILIVMDDFLRKHPFASGQQQILSELQVGWLAHTLLTIDVVTAIATKHDLHIQTVTPLTHMLRLYRGRDKFIHWISPLARLLKNSSQYFRFLLGGNARQQAYRHGLLEYSMLVFRKKQSEALFRD